MGQRDLGIKPTLSQLQSFTDCKRRPLSLQVFARDVLGVTAIGIRFRLAGAKCSPHVFFVSDGIFYRQDRGCKSNLAMPRRN